MRLEWVAEWLRDLGIDNFILLRAAALEPPSTVGAMLLPCLVTLLTLDREHSWRFAAALAGQQATAALPVSVVLAWAGRL